MIILSANEQLMSDGSNFASVIAGITSDVAKMIIMVESGMRHFVDGKIDPNPKPMLSKKINGCTINMFVKRARLTLLLPDHLDFNTYVTMFISQIDMQLHSVETQLRMKHTVFMETNQFAKISREFIPKAGSLILTDDINSQIMKRSFMVGKKFQSLIDPTAFQWLVSNELHDDRHLIMDKSDFVWFADNTMIIVNLTSIPIHRFTSYIQLIDVNAILKQLGITNIVKYTIGDVNSNPIPVDQKDPSDVKNDLSLHVHGFVDVSDHEKNRFVSINRTKEQMTCNDYIAGFLNGEYTPSALHYVCQMCGFKQSKSMYAIVKEIYSSNTRELVGFCNECANSCDEFVILAETKTLIAYYTNIPFSAICEEYNVSKQHIVLFESPKFLKRGYVRDARTFALSHTAQISVRLIGEIVKFHNSLPSGEFVIL